MTDLLFDGQPNYAGNYLIRCAAVAFVKSLPPVVTPGSVSGSLVFHTGFSWQNVYGTEETKEYEEKPDETDDGTIWNVQISCFLPGDSAQLRFTLDQMVRHRFIVECEDNVGLRRRVGTKVENLSFAYSFGVDPQMSGRRGYKLSWSGKLTSPPPIVIA